MVVRIDLDFIGVGSMVEKQSDEVEILDVLGSNVK